MGAGPARSGPPAPAVNRLFRHALEVGKRARTETGHRPRHHVGVAAPRWPWPPSGSGRSTDAASSCSGPARWARAWPPPWPRRPARRRHPRRQPHPRAGRRAGRAGRRPRPIDLGELAAALAEVDVLLTSTGAPIVVLVEHADVARGRWRAAAAGRCSSSTSPCPATSTPSAARLPGVTLLDMDDLRAFAEAGIDERRQEVAAVARHRRRRGRALPARGRRAREVAPLVAALRDRAEDAAAGRARPLPRPARRPRRPPAGGGRGAHPGHRGQAAARAHRAAQGRRRHRPRASASPRPSATSSTSDRRPHRGRLRAATRGSALARWQTDHVGRPAAPRRPAADGRGGGRRDRRRPPPDVPICADRRPGRVREGGAGGGARRAGRPRRALGQGPAVARPPTGLVHRRGARAGRPPRRPRRLHRSTTWPPAALVGHRVGAPAGPAGLAAARPHLRRPAGQHRHPPGQGRRGFDAIVVAAAALDRLGRCADRSARCSTLELMLPQVGQGALAVECRADDDATLRACWPPSTTGRRGWRSTPSGPSSPSSAAAATCRSAPTRSTPTAPPAGACSPPATAASCSATGRGRRSRGASAAASPATSSTTPAAPTSVADLAGLHEPVAGADLAADVSDRHVRRSPDGGGRRAAAAGGR